MASSKDYLDYIMEQLSAVDDVSYRAMMGEQEVPARTVGDNVSGTAYVEEKEVSNSALLVILPITDDNRIALNKERRSVLWKSKIY